MRRQGWLFLTALVASGVASGGELTDDVRKAMGEAGIDMRAVKAQVKAGICGNPHMEQQFDGVTLGVAGYLKKGPVKAGIGVEYALFFDARAKKIRGQSFFYPSVGLEGGKSSPVAAQIGVAFGCKGHPDNYAGYFATASAFGVSLNLGISNDVFDRMGAQVAGVDLKANAPKDYDTYFKDYEQAVKQVGGGLGWVDRSGADPRKGGSAFKKPYKFTTTKDGQYVQTNTRTALSTFIDDMGLVNQESADLLEMVKKFRKLAESATKLSKEERAIQLARVQGEYLATEQKLQERVWRIARFATMMRKYQPNRSVREWVFGGKRLSRTSPSLGATLGSLFQADDTLRDELYNEELAKGTFSTRENQLNAVNYLVDASLAQLDAISGFRHIMSNDRADVFQGQTFKRDRKIGGLPQADKTLSGCNSVSVDPAIFAKSGGQLLLAVGEFGARLAGQQLASIADVNAQLLSPGAMEGIRKAASTAVKEATPSVSLSYYYTPKDLKDTLGIDVTGLFGDGSFEMDIPEAWKDLGDKKALCEGTGNDKTGAKTH